MTKKRENFMTYTLTALFGTSLEEKAAWAKAKIRITANAAAHSHLKRNTVFDRSGCLISFGEGLTARGLSVHAPMERRNPICPSLGVRLSEVPDLSR